MSSENGFSRFTKYCVAGRSEKKSTGSIEKKTAEKIDEIKRIIIELSNELKTVKLEKEMEIIQKKISFFNRILNDERRREQRRQYLPKREWLRDLGIARRSGKYVKLNR